MSETVKRRLIVESAKSLHHFDATGYITRGAGSLDVCVGETITASFAPGWICVYFADAKPEREVQAP